ncbi:MAG TPA: PQQ-binding-like beta-propeller repeat protein [Verrucomicrobiota bacterium]|nr:PQQ-binding-like beta-propeller repeat protein [Verrucomicrobiota bacterium]HNU49827.1 PQQ-binding-like beta-propeller repeat protein [Verrucomicrobiota bacterium]
MLDSWRRLLMVLLVSSAMRADTEWPRFRGPTGDGLALEAQPPVLWSETNHVVWMTALPGRGRSSPVVLGDRIWLTTALERGIERTRIGSDDMQTAEHVTLQVLCLDRASGKQVWQTTFRDIDHPDPVHWFNSWATPTPVIEPDRLYVDFGTMGTACLEAATGTVLWQVQLPLDHQVGPGSSPVLWNNSLILVRDGRDAQYVAALDKTTGKTAWRTDRPPINTSSPNLKKSFSTPIVVQHAGRTQLIAPGAHWTVAYNPATGAEHWRVRHGDGFSIGTCPVFGHGLAFFGTGCFKAQLWAVRADGDGELTAGQVAWKTLRQVPVMSSPVLVGDELYWGADDGMVTCADARTGEIRWQERTGETFLASPLAAAGRLYFFAHSGKTIVLQAGTALVKLAENALPGPVVATPAAAGRSLFLRTDSRLYRLEGPPR